MELADIRGRIRAIIFLIVSIIVLFFVLRILVQYFDLENNGIFTFIYSISDIFLSPFKGLVNIPVEGILQKINFDCIVGLTIYSLFSIALSELITSFFFDNVKDIFQNFLDALYKFVEAFLFLRIVLELFGIGLTNNTPAIISLIYTTTEWSQGNLFEINFLNGRIDLSAILVLAIIILMDIYTERVVDRLILIFGGSNKFLSKYIGNISFPKLSFGRISKIKPPRLRKKLIPDKVVEASYGESNPLSDELIKEAVDSINDIEDKDDKSDIKKN